MVSQRYLARKPHLVTRVFRNLLWNVGRRLFKTITIDTRQGQLTVFTSDQVIGRQLYVRREFESAWIDTALDFLRESDRLPEKGKGTVLDIGANMGVVSIGMLYNSEFKKAIAIEPDPQNFRLLEHNAHQNRLTSDRYLCLPYAASDHEGETEFELSHDNFGDHRVRVESDQTAGDEGNDERFRESTRRTIRVKMDLLDNLIDGLPAEVTEDIAVVWIDTQGHEGHVLAGGTKFFSRDIPVACEIWPYGIERSGMSQGEFCETAAGLWGDYWSWRPGEGFVRRPTSTLDSLWNEFREDPRGDNNVIFTK